jgi:hypothetical protein
MPTSNTTGTESTHASTLRGGAKPSRALDPESVQRFAETFRLRSLAASTQEEYLRFVRKLAARHGGDPAPLEEAQVGAPTEGQALLFVLFAGTNRQDRCHRGRSGGRGESQNGLALYAGARACLRLSVVFEFRSR